MFPSVHGENFISFEPDTGFMMNCELALQLEAVKGQHAVDVVLEVQPSVHYAIRHVQCSKAKKWMISTSHQ